MPLRKLYLQDLFAFSYIYTFLLRLLLVHKFGASCSPAHKPIVILHVYTFLCILFIISSRLLAPCFTQGLRASLQPLSPTLYLSVLLHYITTTTQSRTIYTVYYREEGWGCCIMTR
ncbi:hypothetical protein L202_03612 [Cryptococcus amylolentus CBS 6039]|uniref:Uncharacterized protein n=1 Tax=Cryptococcus amylolentus CBS 6039 TaxID=1295533 RepID=A0A1E3HTP2_9TREE|nr:hypothetical protein L202_03612 [Cryptococcus amylolentus CBS 6039]ODN79682.1 hypothetical protein L202_03612 [Cryptococcus amylolentus CBS 6039]